MTVYETSLPSMHLAGDELTDFENVIKSDTTNPEFSVTIKKDGFEYNLKSMNELIENHDVPDLVEEYQVYLKCDEGEVRLNTKYSRGGSLRLSGETEWVRKKKRQISAQIEKNKILFRTHFSKIVFGAYGLQWLVFLTYSFTIGSVEETNIELVEAVLAVVIFALFVSWPYLLERLVGFLYPYHLLKRDSTVRYRPRVYKSIRVLLTILGVVGGVSGIVTLLN